MMMRVALVGSADAMPKRRRRSMTGTILPRRFTTPSTKEGARGTRVMEDIRTISWTAEMSTAYSSSARRKLAS
ncbi:hypothetical protein D3C87_1981660 [compost metagenome]